MRYANSVWRLNKITRLDDPFIGQYWQVQVFLLMLGWKHTSWHSVYFTNSLESSPQHAQSLPIISVWSTRFLHRLLLISRSSSLVYQQQITHVYMHYIFTYHHHTPGPHCRWVGPWQWLGQGSKGCSRVPLSSSLLLEGHSILSAGWTRSPLLHVWGEQGDTINKHRGCTGFIMAFPHTGSKGWASNSRVALQNVTGWTAAQLHYWRKFGKAQLYAANSWCSMRY